MTISATTVYRHNTECPTREIGDGVVVMAPDGSVTHSLADLGAFIWTHLDGQTDLADLTAAIVAAYQVTPETAAADLHQFISTLLQAGIIQPVD